MKCIAYVGKMIMRSLRSEQFLPLLLSVASLWATPVQAEISCDPLVLTQPATSPNTKYGQGLLWKITSPSGNQASHLFGTMHVADKAITQLPPIVDKAFSAAKSLTVEAQLDGDDALAFSKLMFFDDGTQLKDQLGEDLFDMTAELLNKHSIPHQLVSTLKPWAAYMTLSMPKQKGGMALDLTLMLRAQQRGIPVHGLETLSEQAEVIGGLAMPEQIELLKTTVCHYDVLQHDMQEMKQKYLQRDLTGLMAMTDKYVVDSKQLQDRLLNEMIWKRNKRMVERMLPHLLEDNGFIAVGALHLPGERGILALLEGKGYRVTRVY